MHLKCLKLVNFRNYEEEIFETDSRFNILKGQNAQGKTNLLEAIYISCTGKSFRTSREAEIIRWDSGASYIHGFLETGGREVEVKTALFPGQKKIDVNGVRARGYPVGWPGVVVFLPDDLVMVKGSPQERRRFLDFEIGPFHPQYGHYLARYNRVLSQRSNLLREIRDNRAKIEMLDVWNEQICRYGSKLLFFRLELLKKFNPIICDIHRELTDGVENLNLRYLSSIKLEGVSSEEDIYKSFKTALKAVEKEEISRAQSMIGPHRDDISILINGADARIYGSQGQQRTIVLTFKISEIIQWYNELDEYPILLLDDVLFELDQRRQEALFNRVRGSVQVFVTSTGSEDIYFGDNTNIKKFTVRSGKIVSD